MKRRAIHILGVLLFAALVTGCNDGPVGISPVGISPLETSQTGAVDHSVQPLFATPPSGPVTIVTEIDFSSFPFSGTFVVTEGSGVLGCSGGDFVDTPASTNALTAIRKKFECEGGAGTFTVNFRPVPAPGPGFANGHWNVLTGTGDFANLHGQGNFSLVFTGPSTGQETLTGRIHFDP